MALISMHITISYLLSPFMTLITSCLMRTTSGKGLVN